MTLLACGMQEEEVKAISLQNGGWGEMEEEGREAAREAAACREENSYI